MTELALDAAAKAAFDALFDHLAHGRGGAAWCGYALDAEARGHCLKLDIRNTVDVGDILEAAARRLSDWTDQCIALGAHWAQPNLIARLSNLVDAQAAERVLQDARPGLLKRGLMVGLLHPQSRLGALTATRDSLPFRSEDSFLSMRHAVAADEIFLISHEMKATLRKVVARQLRRHAR